MTKQETFTKRLNKSDILKNINKETYYSVDQFYSDCLRYVKAIKEGRMICNIESVSSSGMSRNIKFLECSKGRTRHNYQNFHSFFRVLGYSLAGKYKDCFRINGCGMDMIFNTNYNNMHNMLRLGVINKKQCANLAQETPTVI